MTWRPAMLLAGATVVVCLLAESSARIVGDGAEYVAMAINFASLRGPALAPRDLDSLQRTVAGVDARFEGWNIRGSSVAAAGGRRDFAHFWIYSLLAAPFVWSTRLAGLSPLVAFTALNTCLLLTAFWVALPRIGAAASVLLFASPVLWWIDKPHTEVFTFSLLAIAFLTLRERPWWSLVASGAAAAQNSPVAVLTMLTAIGHILCNPAICRDRRFQAGALIGGALCGLQPVYTYVKHGTHTLLTLQNPGHLPAWAEITAVPFDPAIGLAGNFPGLVLALFIAAAHLVSRMRPLAVGMRGAVTVATAGGFVFAFSQATNVHHGGTPGLSRYTVWLIPLTIPVFACAYRFANRGVQRWLWPVAALSAISCVFMFRPAVAENAREPNVFADYLWTRHPGWNNPLPEVFAEVSTHAEVRSAPAWTRGCEKVLLIGAGGSASFPVPCYPSPVPPECVRDGTLCYANRRGRGYLFVRAPGSTIAQAGFNYAPERAWPAGSEPAVRDVLARNEWWTLTVRSGGDSALRFARDLRVTELQGGGRLVFVLRDIRPGAEMVLRVPSRMRGRLLDAMTGRIVADVSYDGAPLEPWHISVPAGSNLMMLTLLAS